MLVLLRVHIRVEGRKNRKKIPRGSSWAIASNHLSEFDSFVLAVVFLHSPVHFYMKSSYMELPGRWGAAIRWFLTQTRQIPMPRKDAKKSQKALDQGVMLLAEHRDPLTVYPEGTRSRDGKLHKGHTGLARTLRSVGGYVLPVGLIGTDTFNPIGSTMLGLLGPYRRGELSFGKFWRLWLKGRRIIVRIGDPIEVPKHEHQLTLFGTSRDKAATSRIMQAIQELSGQESDSEYTPIEGE